MLVEEFLREGKLEHCTEFFLNYSTNSFKEGRIKTTGSFLLLSIQVLEFKCEVRLLFTGNNEKQLNFLT